MEKKQLISVMISTLGVILALSGSLCLDHNRQAGIALCFAGIIVLFFSIIRRNRNQKNN